MPVTFVSVPNSDIALPRPFRYWECVIVAGIILYGSLIREPNFHMPPIYGADKWAHLLMYLGLGATLYWDLLRDKQSGWRLWLIAIIVPIVFGGIIEVLQENFFYPRTGDWWDWLADIVGTIMGCSMAYMVGKWWYGRRTEK